MAAAGSQVSVRLAGSRPAFLARRAMDPASRRATSSDRTSWRKSAWGMLCWRARVRRSGRVAVSLPSWRARRVAVRSGVLRWQADGLGGCGPGLAGQAALTPARGRGSGLAAGGGLGLGGGWPGSGPGGGCAVAGGCGGGLGGEAALVVAFEVELLLGVLGAGAPGSGEVLDGGELGCGGGGLGVAF